MIYHLVFCIRLDSEQVIRYGIAQGDASVTASKKIFCQWCVEKSLLVRNDIVENGNYFAMFAHPVCDETKGRGEERHPVSDYQQIRVPFPYGFKSAQV